MCALPAAIATWLAWAALALGHLGLYGWLFDLFANFRVQYLALFALCALVLGIARWRRSAWLALLGVTYTTATLAPYFPRSHAVAAGAQSFRLVTFNVWHRNDRWREFADFLRASDADVAVLQELDAALLDQIASRVPEYPYRAVTRAAGPALAVLSRWPLNAEHIHLSDDAARMSRLSIDWHGTVVVLYGAHLSWPLTPSKAARRAAQLSTLAAHARAETVPVLVAGDFNLTPWSPYFAQFAERSGLVDCALGLGWKATWPAQAAPPRIRIDHCFASRHWRVLRLEVGPKLGSDHLPVVADLELIADGR